MSIFREIQDPVPESPQKYAYGRFRMEWMGTVLDMVHALVTPDRIINATYPLTMEQLDQPYGFVIYETTVPKLSGRLEVKGVRDRAYVIVDGQLASVIQRQGPQDKGNIIQLAKYRNFDDSPANSSKIHILVENQGRVCFGPGINDPKGLINNVTLNDQILTNWTMYPIDIGKIYTYEVNMLRQMRHEARRRSPLDAATNYIPSIYYGYFFTDPKPGDTFFDPSGWGKGQLYINGRNIGRYWPQAGPQITLYVPGVYLAQAPSSGEYFNQIFVLELDQPGGCETDEKYGCWAQFTNQQKYTN